LRIKELNAKIKALRGKPFRLEDGNLSRFEVWQTDEGNFMFSNYTHFSGTSSIMLNQKQVNDLIAYIKERMEWDGKEETEDVRRDPWGASF